MFRLFLKTGMFFQTQTLKGRWSCTIGAWLIDSYRFDSIKLFNLTFHFFLWLQRSSILNVAAEVCNVSDTMTADQIVEGDDIWATILSMTRKTAANRRKSIDPPKTNAPNPWNDCNKHAAIGNLLSIAVSHKDLKLRKAYIERIMTLSPTTQRLLMSMIVQHILLFRNQPKAPYFLLQIQFHFEA